MIMDRPDVKMCNAYIHTHDKDPTRNYLKKRNVMVQIVRGM